MITAIIYYIFGISGRKISQKKQKGGIKRLSIKKQQMINDLL
jgi:hypothetical protein